MCAQKKIYPIQKDIKWKACSSLSHLMTTVPSPQRWSLYIIFCYTSKSRILLIYLDLCVSVKKLNEIILHGTEICGFHLIEL